MPLEIVNGTLLDQDADVILLPQNYYPTNQVNQELLDALKQSRAALKTAERIRIPFSKFLRDRYIAYRPPQGEPLYTEIAYVPFGENRCLLETEAIRMRRPHTDLKNDHPKSVGIYRLICFWRVLLPFIWEELKKEWRTLAVPIVGLGYDGIPADLAGSIAVNCLRKYFEKSGSDRAVTLVLSLHGFPEDLTDRNTFHDWKFFYRTFNSIYSSPPDMLIWKELAKKGLPNQTAFIQPEDRYRPPFRVGGAAPEQMKEYIENTIYEEPPIDDSSQFEESIPLYCYESSEEGEKFDRWYKKWVSNTITNQHVLPMPAEHELSPRTDTEQITKEINTWEQQPGGKACGSQEEYMHQQGLRYLKAAIKKTRKDETAPLPKTVVFDTQHDLALASRVAESSLSRFMDGSNQTLIPRIALKLACSMQLEPYDFQRFIWMASQKQFSADKNKTDMEILNKYTEAKKEHPNGIDLLSLQCDIDSILVKNDKKEIFFPPESEENDKDF